LENKKFQLRLELLSNTRSIYGICHQVKTVRNRSLSPKAKNKRHCVRNSLARLWSEILGFYFFKEYLWFWFFCLGSSGLFTPLFNTFVFMYNILCVSLQISSIYPTILNNHNQLISKKKYSEFPSHPTSLIFFTWVSVFS
jgi:hypothetical protein